MITLLVGLSVGSAKAEVTVSNLAIAQLPGTKLVEITYDLACDDPNEIEIQLSISNTVSISTSSAVGDIGTPIAVGSGKTIHWDMGQDWDGATGSLQITVSAKNLIVGADPSAISWQYLNDRWVQNTYSDSSQTLTDRESGLMWRYADIGYGDWDEALAGCSGLNYAGYDDWFLPDVDQLSNVYGQNAYLKNWSTSGDLPHWTSSTVDGYPSKAWAIGMQSGSISERFKNYNGYIRPCRYAAGSTNSGYVAASASGSFDSRDYNLTVYSEHGSPIPANGIHSNYCWKSTVTCSVDLVSIVDSTNFLCTGWVGTGTIPPSGVGNTANIVLENMSSTLSWVQEVAHYIDFEIIGSGSLNFTDSWVVEDEELAIQATPDSGWSFWGWEDDLVGDYRSSNVTIQVSSPMLISAVFIQDLDQDHMDDDWEIQNFGTIAECDPDDDTDGDRYTNLEEYLNEWGQPVIFRKPLPALFILKKNRCCHCGR